MSRVCQKKVEGYHGGADRVIYEVVDNKLDDNGCADGVIYECIDNERGDNKDAKSESTNYEAVKQDITTSIDKIFKQGDNGGTYTGSVPKKFMSNHANTSSKIGKKLLNIFIVIIITATVAAFFCSLIAFIKILNLESGQQILTDNSFNQSITHIQQAISILSITQNLTDN